ncbi:MAG: hypothetical protein N2654_07545, partial [Deltaproteobacteria bacterium]|nr:hypothetical protein [Deltaproteobacteria bacterium]
MSRVKNKPFFRNPEGTLIRIKALLEATRVREGLEEAEKLADQRLSSKNAFRLEKILKEKIRIDGGSFVTELSAYPNLRKLVGVESDISSQAGPISSRDFDTTMFQNTQPELV